MSSAASQPEKRLIRKMANERELRGGVSLASSMKCVEPQAKEIGNAGNFYQFELKYMSQGGDEERI